MIDQITTFFFVCGEYTFKALILMFFFYIIATILIIILNSLLVFLRQLAIKRREENEAIFNRMILRDLTLFQRVIDECTDPAEVKEFEMQKKRLVAQRIEGRIFENRGCQKCDESAI